MKKLKVVTRCNMCPYCMKYGDGSKECGYVEGVLEIKKAKRYTKNVNYLKTRQGNIGLQY